MHDEFSVRHPRRFTHLGEHGNSSKARNGVYFVQIDFLCFFIYKEVNAR